MRANEYQQLAARTINHDLNNQVIEEHALFGMAGEVGEIHSLYQKVIKGISSMKNMQKANSVIYFGLLPSTVPLWDGR